MAARAEMDISERRVSNASQALFEKTQSMEERVGTPKKKPVAEAALVDRSGGEADLGIPFIPLISLDFPVYDADDLPEELAAIPAVKPGSREKK